jgi:penicillin amidase
MADEFPSVELLTNRDSVTHVYVEEREKTEETDQIEQTDRTDKNELYALTYANGYVQARDRLFQMDALRHIGYGDSAGILGPMQLESDLQVRRDLYSREELKAQYESANEVTRISLQGFADGVNRQLINRLVAGDLPAEFLALGHAPEPWSPVDSVAVLCYMIGFFGVDGGTELENAKTVTQLVETLSDERTAYETYRDLNWLRVPDEHYTTLDSSELTVDGDESVPEYEEIPDEQFELALAADGAQPWGIDPASSEKPLAAGIRQATGVLTGFKWGSNALSVAGEHTETGQPMLFGGPQMGYFSPPVIHEIGLHGAGFDVAGIGVVGTPGVVIGRTPAFTWSVTSGFDDQVDTIAVRLHPEDRHRYEWNGEWREMRTETIDHDPSLLGALGNEDWPHGQVEQEISRIEERGTSMPVVAWNSDERVAWCQRTTTRGDELDGVFVWAELGRQESLDEFETQLAEFPFTFNFIYADEEDIAFIHTGKVPDRNSDLDHRLPAPGAKHRWEGMRVGTGLGMTVRNPERGYIAQWNNAPAAGWRAGDTEQRWGSIHRVDLLDRLTREAIDEGPLSLDDVERILQNAATRSPIAGASTPAFVDAARNTGMDSIADELDRWAKADYTWIAEDGTHLPGVAIWEETRRELQELVFREELGDITPDLCFDPPTDIDLTGNEDSHAGDHGRTIREVTFVDALCGRTDYDWFGDDPEVVIQTALSRVREKLSNRFDNTDPSTWRRPARTTDFRAISAAEEQSIEMVNRGSWNQIVSLATGEGRAILPPGNSGHISLRELPGTVRGKPPSRLNDQLIKYESFEYKPFLISRENIEKNATRSESLSVLPKSGFWGQALGTLEQWLQHKYSE